MGKFDSTAFLPCRRCTPGERLGAAMVPRMIPSLPASLAQSSAVLQSHSHGNNDTILDETDILKTFPTANDVPYDQNHSMPMTRRSTIGNLSERIDGAKSTARKPATSRFLSLFCAALVVLGAPNLDGAVPGAVTVNYKASALESARESNNNDPSSTAWPASPSSALSEKLFKSMSAREGTRDSTPIPRTKQRYWDSMNGSTEEIKFANEKLVDHAVATISTMYYDTSGGFNFDSQEFYAKWKKFKYTALHPHEGAKSNSRDKNYVDEFGPMAANGLETRDNAVKTLKSIVSTLNDPYSKYLTREELRMELMVGNDGFLGLGALVEASSSPPSSLNLAALDAKRPMSTVTSTSSKEFDRISNRPWYGGQGGMSFESSVTLNQQFAVPLSSSHGGSSSGSHNGKSNSKKATILSLAEAANLPVVTAIIPDSPAERAGLVVGDRIAAVGDYQFTGMSRSQVEKTLRQKFHAENYFGRADLTVAKQLVASFPLGSDDVNARYDADGNVVEEKYVFEDGWYRPKDNRQRIFNSMMPSEQVVGYKLSHVKSIPTTLTAKLGGPAYPLNAAPHEMSQQSKFPSVVGGDSIVHFELLTPDDSIFQHMTDSGERRLVGYIRLTRFSKSSTAGYINAINSLEEAGAQSYIIDLRNNYGGVIQEAMLTASTLLRDPHSVLCYTLNSRGGFKPQENQEYVVDPKYPGYLLSSESSTVSRDQVRREHPEYLEDGGWTSPTSYASLRELRMTRGIKPARTTSISSNSVREGGLERPTGSEIDLEKLADAMARNSQKKLVILINEGTASAAEVFASALHDNGRTVALVGTKTFGKGLIQHTFPMPDGGGLRLTVAEYLTPSLQHVTKVGGAKNDSGVKPDIRCESKQGIPQNIGADLCVGVALDVLESEGV